MKHFCRQNLTKLKRIKINRHALETYPTLVSLISKQVMLDLYCLTDIKVTKLVLIRAQMKTLQL